MVSTSYIGEQNNNRSVGPRQHSFQTWDIENPGMAGYMCFSSGKLNTKN